MRLVFCEAVFYYQWRQSDHNSLIFQTPMDLDFVEEKDRADILKLMEVCGIDLMEAYQLFENSNHSFEAAVNMHFSQGAHEEPIRPNHPIRDEPQHQAPLYVAQDFETSYENYRAFRQSGMTFPDKYQVRKQAGLMSWVPKFLKPAQESDFRDKVEKFIGKQCIIKYMPISLSETIEQYSWKEKFPILVQVMDFSPASRAKLTEILRDPSIVDYCNVQFRTHGLHVGEYQLERDLTPFFDLTNERNVFVILRVNALDEIEVLDKIPLLTTSIKDITQKIKLSKNICINKEIEQTHLEKRFNQELMGNFDYQKPVSISEKRKIANDRALRKKQEEQFFASMKAEEQKKKVEQGTGIPERDYPRQQKKERQPVQTKPPVPQKPKIDWQVKRQKVRNTLRTYDSGMTIKLRVPSGDSVIVTVAFDEKAQYLYDYIFSLEQDLGFESPERRFDIVRPYDRLNLSECLDKKLREVFEESEMESLIVTEKQ